MHIRTLPNPPMHSTLVYKFNKHPEDFQCPYRDILRISSYKVAEKMTLDELIQKISLTRPRLDGLDIECVASVGNFLEFPSHNFSIQRYRNLLENLFIPVCIAGVWSNIYWHKEQGKFRLRDNPDKIYHPGEKVFCVIVPKK